jgi:signal transduction histidine kinase
MRLPWEGHGGRIIVSSELDVGSTFTVFLPKLSDVRDV